MRVRGTRGLACPHNPACFVILQIVWSSRFAVAAQLSSFLQHNPAHPQHAHARALLTVLAPDFVDAAARAAPFFEDDVEDIIDDASVDRARARVDAFFADAVARGVAVGGVVVEVVPRSADVRRVSDRGPTCIVSVGPGRVIVEDADVGVGALVAVRIRRTAGQRLMGELVDVAGADVRLCPVPAIARRAALPPAFIAGAMLNSSGYARAQVLSSRFADTAWSLWHQNDPEQAVAWALVVDDPRPAGARAARLRARAHRRHDATLGADVLAALKKHEPAVLRRAACRLARTHRDIGLRAADALAAVARAVDADDIDVDAAAALLAHAPIKRPHIEHLEHIALDRALSVRRRCRAASALAAQKQHERVARFLDVDAAAAVRVARGDIDAVLADVLAGDVAADVFVDVD